MIGTPVRGRSQPGLESLMGFFVNALPLRLARGARPVLHLAAASRAQRGRRRLRCAGRALRASGAGAGQAPRPQPLPHLPGLLFLSGRAPAAFALGRTGAREPARVPGRRRQDVALWFLEGSDGLVGGLNFNTDILLRDTAMLLQQRFLRMLEGIAHGSAADVRELLAIDPVEAARMDEWNATGTPVPGAQNLVSYLQPAFAAHAAARRRRCRARRHSPMRELDARANRIAACLARARCGRRIAGRPAPAALAATCWRPCWPCCALARPTCRWILIFPPSAWPSCSRIPARNCWCTMPVTAFRRFRWRPGRAGNLAGRITPEVADRFRQRHVVAGCAGLRDLHLRLHRPAQGRAGAAAGGGELPRNR